MDPGNWATDIEAGSRFGFNLLFVVLLSSLAAVVLQCLCLRLGLVAEKDLAQLCRERFSPLVNRVLWFFAEIAIIACDLAEVLGSALAFHLLFGCSLMVGVAITALDTLIVLGLKGKGFRQIEAIILGLVLTISACYFVELLLIKPNWSLVAWGFVPSLQKLSSTDSIYLAIGIIGATVMPHNLYLHTSIVQTRLGENTFRAKQEAIRFSTADTVFSLSLAFVVNAAILILAGAAFHATGHSAVTEIEDAYKLLEPIVGGRVASLVFAVGLLAAGQSSTFTGTIAGQVIMEGHLELKIPCWQRRVITRSLALIPAFVGLWMLGENSTGRLLVLSQVILSLQLPFVILPLILFTNSQAIMGPFVNSALRKLLVWSLFVAISLANLWLIWSFFTSQAV
jgi:manganese transport protein